MAAIDFEPLAPAGTTIDFEPERKRIDFWPIVDDTNPDEKKKQPDWFKLLMGGQSGSQVDAADVPVAIEGLRARKDDYLARLQANIESQPAASGPTEGSIPTGALPNLAMLKAGKIQSEGTDPKVLAFAETPFVQPRNIPKDEDRSYLGNAAAGIYNTLANTGGSFTSPMMLSTLGLGVAPAVVGKAASGMFAGQMISSIPEAWKAVQEADKTPAGSQERWEAGLNMVTLGLFTHIALGHFVKGAVPVKTEPSVETPPAADPILAVAKPTQTKEATTLADIPPERMVSRTGLQRMAQRRLDELNEAASPSPIITGMNPDGTPVFGGTKNGRALNPDEMSEREALQQHLAGDDIEGLADRYGYGIKKPTQSQSATPTAPSAEQTAPPGAEQATENTYSAHPLQPLIIERNRLMMQDLPRSNKGSYGEAAIEARIAEIDNQLREHQKGVLKAFEEQLLNSDPELARLMGWQPPAAKPVEQMTRPRLFQENPTISGITGKPIGGDTVVRILWKEPNGKLRVSLTTKEDMAAGVASVGHRDFSKLSEAEKFASGTYDVDGKTVSDFTEITQPKPKPESAAAVKQTEPTAPPEAPQAPPEAPAEPSAAPLAPQPTGPVFAEGKTVAERVDNFLNPGADATNPQPTPTAIRFKIGEQVPDEIKSSPFLRREESQDGTIFHERTDVAPSAEVPVELTPEQKLYQEQKAFRQQLREKANQPNRPVAAGETSQTGQVNTGGSESAGGLRETALSGDTGEAVLVEGPKRVKINIPYNPSGQPDLIDFIGENGGIRMRNTADYDALTEDKNHPALRFYKGKLLKGVGDAGEMAQMAHEAGLIRDAYPDTLWEGISQAIKNRQSYRSTTRAMSESGLRKQAVNMPFARKNRLFETTEPESDPVVGTDINGTPIQQSKQGTYYTMENGRPRTGPAFSGDGPTVPDVTTPPVQQKAYSQESLQSAFELTDSQAEASDALVQAMGLDTSRLFMARGGNPTEGALFKLVAHHGTPHTVDSFKLEKIGTGEGAQVYGWGIYFAENKAVAEEYRKNLSKKAGAYVDGKPAKELGQIAWEAADDIAALGGNVDAYIAQQKLRRGAAIESSEKAGNTKRADILRDVLREEIESAESLRTRSITRDGNTYTVSLDVEPSDLLDWDKPLSEQSAKVKAAVLQTPDAKRYAQLQTQLKELADAGKFYSPEGDAIVTESRELRERLGFAPTSVGSEFYHQMAAPGSPAGKAGFRQGLPSSGAETASAYLRSLGIPGIRYLDQGSRGASGGEIIGVWQGEQSRMENTGKGKWFARIKSIGRQPDGSAEGWKNSPPHDTAESARKWAEEATAAKGTYNYVIFDESKIKITHQNGREFTPQEYEKLQQGQQGSAEFSADGRAVIRGLSAPNVSTGVHELAHVARRQLFDKSIPEAKRYGITDAHITTAEQWAGAKDGKWNRAAEEKFARGFERYLRDGKAPNERLADIFASFKQWLGTIYKKLKGSEIDIHISPAMRGVFDALVTRGMDKRNFKSAENVYQEPVAAAATPPPIPRGPTDERTAGVAPEVTSTKNAVTDQERVSRGIAAAEQEASREFGTVWNDAKTRLAEDPTAGTRLVNELNEKPRALSDTENAVLLHRQIEVQNEHAAAVEAVNRAANDSERTGALSRLDDARDALQATYDAAKAAGTETGRGLNARKMMARNDFSLAQMEARYRAEGNEGKPLSATQASQVKLLHDRIKIAETKVAEYEARDQFRTEMEQARKEARANKTTAGSSRRSFLQKEEAKARERIISRRGRLNTGLDPTALLDEAIIGAAHIERGLNLFSEWSNKMVADFGKQIKPYLAKIFAQSRALHAESVRTFAEKKELRRLESDKWRIQRDVARYEAHVMVKDVGPVRPPRKATPLIDKEKAKLLLDRDKAKEAYHEMIVRDRLRNQDAIKKFGRYFGEGLRTARSIKTSFDLSAMFRQGGFNYFAHPIEATRAVGPMMRALKSEAGQTQIMEEIRARPNYPRYKQSGLFIAENSTASLSKMEEAYASRLAGKIPGVAASERAYTTYLNRIRADRFDAMDASLGKRGKVTPEEAKIIANFVNVTSGRGNPGRFAAGMEAMSAGFFAPRFVLSRFQTLIGQPLTFMRGKGTPRVRRLIAMEYARTLTGIGLFMAAATAGGAVIETDPRSSDFLKLRFGTLRIDPMFGISQVAVFLARELSGKTKTAKGDVKPLRGDLPYGSRNAFDVATSFGRTKLNPALGGAVNVMIGKDPVGNPTSLTNELLKFALPLGPGDIAATMVANGVPRKLALALLAAGGVGTASYGNKSQNNQKTQRAQLNRRDSALWHGNVSEAAKRTWHMERQSLGL